MKISYDPKIDAIYIRFGEGKYDRTKKVTDDILVDVTKNGKVLGLEIIDATKNISALKSQGITFDWASFSKPSREQIPPRYLSA